MNLPEVSGSTATPAGAAPAASASRVSAALIGRSLGVAMILMLLAILASRSSGMVRDAIVAYQFGTTATTDSFVAAFTLPDLLASLLLAGLVGVAVIPVLLRAEVEAKEDWRLANSVLNLVLVTSVVIAVLGVVAAGGIIRIFTPGLDAAHTIEATYLTRIMFPALVLFAAGSVFTAILNGNHRFVLPTLAGLVVNLAMIVGAVTLSRRLGIQVLAWAFLVGAAFQLAIQIPPVLRMGFGYHFELNLRDPRLRSILLAMVPLLLVITFQYSRLVIERWLGSDLAAGTIAILNFANRVMLLAPAIIVAPVSTVLYPLLSRRVIADDQEDIVRLVISGIRLILLGTVPAALLLRYLSHPLVAAIYQRGAFDARSSAATAYLLGLFALALVPFSVNEFITRTYFARQRSRFALRATFVGLLVTFVGDLVFTRLIGFPGLALGATAGAWTLLGIFVVELSLWRAPELVKSALRTLLAAILATAVAVAAYALAGAAISGIPRLATSLLLAGAVYVVALLVLRTDDLRLVRRLTHAQVAG